MSTDPEVGSDEQPGCLPPRERYDLFGHEPAETQFATAWSTGKLHHAWLITGPRGVGKASFAWRAARRVLGAQSRHDYGPLGSDPADPICRQMEAFAAPDLLLLRPPWDDKRKRWRAEITVNEARRVSGFFEKSAGGDGWRVCIIDAMDSMNNNAANALLKTLEEPPRRGLLLLIAHTPGRMPATIRSRCRRLELRPSDRDSTADWLMQAGGPDHREDALELCDLAGNAPGRALALNATGGLQISQDVAAFLRQAQRTSEAESRRLAEQVCARGQEGKRPIFFNALAQQMHQKARNIALDGGDPTAWLDAERELEMLVRQSDSLYLDAKQTALSALALARDAARRTG